MKKLLSIFICLLMFVGCFPIAAMAGTAETYTVTLSVNPEISGLVYGAGSYSDGDEVTVYAKPISGYRFDHWKREDGSTFDDLRFVFIIHENCTYEAIFVEDPSYKTKYTLEVPDNVVVSPNEEFTAASANITELCMATEPDGRTPIKLRLILNSGTLINQDDNSKKISFHPDSYINSYPALNQCMLDFTSDNNQVFYVRIESSEWSAASPGTYTGNMSYIVRWLYEGNNWSGDIETGTIPISVTISDTISEPPVVQGHNHTEVIDPAVEPSCTEPGKTEGSHCDVCGEVIKIQETIPKKDHVDSDNDGFCDSCKNMMTGGEHCVHCGKIHNGFLGFLIKFIHQIIHFFSK